MSVAQQHRARVAGLTSRRASPEKIEAARRDLKYAVAENDIRELVATWPPLTETQKAKLAILLLAPGGDDRAAG